MYKILLLLCIFLVTQRNLLAQTEIDSLKEKLHQVEQMDNHDSIASLLYQISYYYAYRNVDSMIIYTEQGLKLVDREKESPYIELLSNKITYHNNIGNSKQAIQDGLFTLQEAKRLHCSDALLGDLLSSLGVCYRRNDQLDSALICYNKAVTYMERVPEDTKDDLPFLLTNIAILYTNSSRLEEGETYIRKAIKSLETTNDMDAHIYVCNSAGSIFCSVKKYDEAKNIILQSYEKAKKENKPHFVIQCASPLLSLFSHLGDVKAIDKYVAEIEPWLKLLPENCNEIVGYKEALAYIYTSEKRFAESNKIFEDLLRIHDTNAQAPTYLLHMEIARNYIEMGEPLKAASHYERAIAVTDSIHNTEIGKQLSEFTVKFETQEKQLEIARLNEESFKQKNETLIWTIVAVVVIALCIAILIYGYIKKKKMQHESEIKSIESFIRGLEQERTRLGKELHDGICNDILGVAMMIQAGENDKESRKKILKGLEMIRSDVRAISHELTPPQFKEVSIDEVTEHFVNNLCAPNLMKVTFEKEGENDDFLNIPENISYNLYRILQELMSNIIHYSAATSVYVFLKVDHQTVSLMVSNNGKKFDINGKHRNGIGLSTIEERIKSMRATFQKEIEEGKQSFRIDVSW